MIPTPSSTVLVHSHLIGKKGRKEAKEGGKEGGRECRNAGVKGNEQKESKE